MNLATRRILAVIATASVMAATTAAIAAETQSSYYAHQAVEDEHGVIAPWYQGQNGQLDERVRIAAEFLKRYPWVDADRCVVPGPHYLFNARVDMSDDGTVQVLPASPHMNGNLGQRFRYITKSATDYYRYTADPTLLGHMKLAADFLLEGYQTDADHPWPSFPISVPNAGTPYGRYAPGGHSQLDLAAGMGRGMIRAYKLLGDRRYLDAAKRWADVFAAKCDHRPGHQPWPRWIPGDQKKSPWAEKKGIQKIHTGGVVNILLLLDDVIRLGHTGDDDAILRAKATGEAYLRDTLLADWLKHDHWGRHYWDWDHPIQGVVATGWATTYMMNHKDAFPNWRNDVRNLLGLQMHRACVNPDYYGDTYSGAWAYPESAVCCGRQLDFCPVFMSRYWARYAQETDSPWAREIARRKITLGFYHFHESGKVEDNIDGGQIITKNWSELIGIGPITTALDFLEWMPELGPARENHILRSSSTVTRIVYGKGEVAYTTFDAPAETVDVIRLAFRPESVTADGTALTRRDDLGENGYTIAPIGQGDFLVTVRHDHLKQIVIRGDDPQQVIDDTRLVYQGNWSTDSHSDDVDGGVHVADSSGAAAIHRFEGNQVRLIGRVGPDGGLADVYLDGERQPTLIDCWCPAKERHQQVLYYRNGLGDGPHELKVVARGEGNPASSGGRLLIDAVQVSSATAEPAFGAGGGPRHAQRMILGYPHRKPYIDSAGEAWFPATELVVQTGRRPKVNTTCWRKDPVRVCWWTEPSELVTDRVPDAELYRYGVHHKEFWVNVTVAPGTYRVGLKLAERRGEQDRARRPMTILIGGRTVAEQLDVAGEAGGLGQPLDLSFPGIRPRNGVIEIRVRAPGGEAILQAVEVEPEGTS